MLFLSLSLSLIHTSAYISIRTQTQGQSLSRWKTIAYPESWLYLVLNFPGESIVAFVGSWMRFACTNIHTSIHFQVKTWMLSHVWKFFKIPYHCSPSFSLTGNMYAPLLFSFVAIFSLDSRQNMFYKCYFAIMAVVVVANFIIVWWMFLCF